MNNSPTKIDVADLTARDAVERLRHGDLRAGDYAEALLGRCELHKELNAFISLDASFVLDQAQRADELYRRGESRGRLHGLPVAIKDNINTADAATTCGTPALKKHRPKKNARVVQALLDAGAILFGKTNLHELGCGITSNNGEFGPVRNPYDRTRIAGGSSGGTAAALAARLVPSGLGTSTGSSVRLPSALCGIIGFRPSTGRYPTEGLVPISPTRDTAGTMARSVADLILLDGVITGGPIQLDPARLEGLRLGVPRDYFYDNLDPEVAAAMERVLERLSSHGIQMIDVDLGGIDAVNRPASLPIADYEIVPNLNAYLAAHSTGLDFAAVVAQVASPDVEEWLTNLMGEGAISQTVYRKAIDELRPRLQRMYRDCFARYDVRGLVFPTTPLPAALIGEDKTVRLNGRDLPTFEAFTHNTDPTSIAGTPGLSLPIGLTSSGLPIGMEIDGAAGADLELLSIALAIEAHESNLPAPS